MKKLIILLIAVTTAFSACAQWKGVTGTAQKNTASGKFRWNFGSEGIFAPNALFVSKTFPDSISATKTFLTTNTFFSEQAFINDLVSDLKSFVNGGRIAVTDFATGNNTEILSLSLTQAGLIPDGMGTNYGMTTLRPNQVTLGIGSDVATLKHDVGGYTSLGVPSKSALFLANNDFESSAGLVSNMDESGLKYNSIFATKQLVSLSTTNGVNDVSILLDTLNGFRARDPLLRRGGGDYADYSATKQPLDWVTLLMLNNAIAGLNLSNKSNLSGGNAFTGNQSIDGVLTQNNVVGSINFSTEMKDGVVKVNGQNAFGILRGQYERDGIRFYHEEPIGTNLGTAYIHPAVSGNIDADLILPVGNGTLAKREDFSSGQTIGANTTGNASTASSALAWGGYQADFTTGPAGVTTGIIGWSAADNKYKEFANAAIKTFLATSLQDVTTVSSTTTHDITLDKAITGSAQSSPYLNLIANTSSNVSRGFRMSAVPHSNPNAQKFIIDILDAGTWSSNPLLELYGNGTLRIRNGAAGFQGGFAFSNLTADRNWQMPDASGELAIKVRQERYSGISDSNGEYTVTFATPYASEPNIQVTLVGGSDTEFYRVTNLTDTGFTILVRDITSYSPPTWGNVVGAKIKVLITEP